MNANELLEVGFLLYCDPYASHMESRGVSYSGQALENAIPRPPHRQLLPIIRKAVKRLEESWGAKLVDVIAEYNIDDPVIFLFCTFMGIQGHGISLEDYLYDNNIKDFKYETTPYEDEMSDLWNIATFDAYKALQLASEQNNNKGRWRVVSQHSSDDIGDTVYFEPSTPQKEVKRLLLAHDNYSNGIRVIAY